MNREQLKALGLTDEQVDVVMKEHGKIVNTSKEQVQTLTNERDELKTQLADRDKQLTTLKKAAEGNDELQKQIQTLQDENKTVKEKYDADMKELRITTAIKLAVAGDAHDPALITGLVDRAKLVLADDGTVAGLEDQIKSLRESKAFLFVEKDDGSGTKFKGTKPPEGSDKGDKSGQKNPWSKEHFNLTEQGRILRDDPDLAKQLQAAAK